MNLFLTIVLSLLLAAFLAVMFFRTAERRIGKLLGLPEKDRILKFLGLGVQGELGGEAGLFGPRDKPTLTFEHTVTATPGVMSALQKREGVTVQETEDGKVQVAVTGRIDG